MKNKNLASLQCLRGVAALMVVFHHSIRAVNINNGSLTFGDSLIIQNRTLMELGSAGVDIFFILSGFIMVYISDKYLHQKHPFINFAKHRFIRIWPIYAIVTLILILPLLPSLAKYILSDVNELPFDLQPIRLASLLFIPSFNQYGKLQPILGVGWTLNYEILFYILFSLSLLFKRVNLVFSVTVLMLIIYMIGKLLLPSQSVLHAFFGNTIIFEFLLGAWIGLMYKNDLITGKKSALFLVGGFLTLIVTTYFGLNHDYRFMTTGVGAALIFIGALTIKESIRFPKSLIVLGDASYSIYLIHTVVIYMFIMRAMRKLSPEITGSWNQEVVVILMTIISVFCGILFYYAVERPTLKWFRKKM